MSETVHFGFGAITTAGLFLALGLAEMAWPARRTTDQAGPRFLGNVVLYLLPEMLLLLPAAAAIAAATTARGAAAGVLGWLYLPSWLHAAAALLVLDAVTYASHRLSHVVPALWRLHAVHHSDPALDVSTTLRHHPVEAIYTTAFTVVAVVTMGISAAEVAGFIVLEWAVQLAAHANIGVPRDLDTWLSRILVTPGFHQRHHSRDVVETDTNFGQVFVFWDILFGSLCRVPRSPACAVEFGLDDFRDARSQWLDRLLAQPWLPRTGPADHTRPAAPRALTPPAL
jgi:sterol desaturase/sphingolipid hydroxylase (fatty acid hydroxylase superfamily)